MKTCFFIGHREADERLLPELMSVVERLIICAVSNSQKPKRNTRLSTKQNWTSSTLPTDFSPSIVLTENTTAKPFRPGMQNWNSSTMPTMLRSRISVKKLRCCGRSNLISMLHWKPEKKKTPTLTKQQFNRRIFDWIIGFRPCSCLWKSCAPSKATPSR